MKVKQIIFFPFIFPLYMCLLWIKSRRELAAAAEPLRLTDSISNLSLIKEQAELRELRFLTARSRLVQEGSCIANEFILWDNGDTEGIGAIVTAKIVSRRPRASVDSTPNYNPDSEIFKAAKAAQFGFWGEELTLELSSGERVTLFCGTKNLRKKAKKVKLHKSYTLTAKQVHTKVITFWTIDFEKPEWAHWNGTPLAQLDHKHLWNIFQAMENKQWATGKPCFMEENQANAIYDEYKKRERRGLFKVDEIKAKNEAWVKSQARRRF